MDSGAHFRCCDLQVHSPRDRNWHGPCPNNENERKEYAKEFVSNCRQRGLQAVAITDHHDLAFFPYIREAARAETDASGNPRPEREKLIVFPGMELTLALPCQALLIFDRELSDDTLTSAVHALGIEPAPAADAKTKEVVKLRFTS